MFLDRSNSVLGFVPRVDVGDVGLSELYGPCLHGVRTQGLSSFQQFNTVVGASNDAVCLRRLELHFSCVYVVLA
jgi:hypothetical protein